MFKRGMVVVALMACVGVAYGTTKKIRAFSLPPVEAAFQENPNVDGVAMLSTSEGVGGAQETRIQMALTGLLPNTTYAFAVIDHSGLEFLYRFCGGAGIYTDSEGQGSYKASFPGDITSSGIVIYRSDDCDFTTDEARAVGYPSE
jgi:hypothetical protein